MTNFTPLSCLINGSPVPVTNLLTDEVGTLRNLAVNKAKIEQKAENNSEQIRQLTGQAGQDLFFNGWKLLF